MDPETYGDDQQGSGGWQNPGPPVFTQADDLRLQKLQQGLSAAQDQVDAGVLHPEEADQFTQEIGARIGPLVQRQQAAQAWAKKQQTQQLMEQSALAGAIGHQDSALRMEGFKDKVAQHIDPDTGATSYFYEKEPGKVEQMDPAKFIPAGTTPGQDQGAAEATGPGAGGGYTPAAQAASLATGADQGIPPGDASLYRGGPPADQPRPGQPTVQPAADGGHVMTIVNGQNQEQWHFAPNGTTTFLGANGQSNPQVVKSQADIARIQNQIYQPQGQDQANPLLGLTQTHIRELVGQARQIVGEPPPSTGNARLDAINQGEYKRQLATTTRDLAQMHVKGQQQQAQEKWRTEENARQKAAQAEEDRKKETARQARDEAKQHAERTEQQISSSYRHHLGEVRKEVKEGSTIKDIEGEAWDRVDAETRGVRKRVNPVKPKASEYGPPAPAGSVPHGTEPASRFPTPPHPAILNAGRGEYGAGIRTSDLPPLTPEEEQRTSSDFAQ